MQDKNKRPIDWILIAKYISQTISEAENVRLQNWLKGDARRGKFLEHARHYYSRQDFPLPDEKQIDEIWIAFLGEMKRKRAKRIRLQMLRIAAMFILLIGGFWTWKTLDISPDMLVYEPRILPARHQATLILSDGSSVNLGNAEEERILTDRDVPIGQQGKKLVYSGYRKNADTLFNTIQVPQGGEYHLVLSDGTEVWLNAQTRFTYPVAFGEGERKVQLEGEAYFEVQPDGKRFVVETRKMDICVLGTAFNVNAYPDEKATVTTLVKGKVEISAATGKRILQPGEQASREDGEISVEQVNPLYYTQWKEGYFSFRDNRLTDIMHVLARWYDMEYAFESPELKEIRFFGVLSRYRDMKELLHEFEKTGKVKFRYEGHKVWIGPGEK